MNCCCLDALSAANLSYTTGGAAAEDGGGATCHRGGTSQNEERAGATYEGGTKTYSRQEQCQAKDLLQSIVSLLLFRLLGLAWHQLLLHCQLARPCSCQEMTTSLSVII